MINRNRFSWLGSALAAAVLALGFSAGCDDDTEEVTPDADVQEPDACQGHVCPGASPTLTLQEGGVLRYELFHRGYENDDVTAARTEDLGGWFFAFTGQDPAAREILGPLVDGTDCFDVTGNNYFLNGYSQENQAIADTRSYYDVGESVTVTTDGGEDIVMPKQENAIDDSTRLTHDIVYKTDPADAAKLLRGAMYTLNPIGPNGDFPGLDVKAGVDVIKAANELPYEWTDPPAMYFPPDFTLDAPTEAEYFGIDEGNATGNLRIDQTADLTFEWTKDAEIPAEWPLTVQFTGFLDENHTFRYLCVVAEAAGTMTIPASMFDAEQYPEMPRSGEIIHGSLNHIAWNQEEHRFDIIGVNCKESTYELYDPAAQ